MELMVKKDLKQISISQAIVNAVKAKILHCTTDV